MTKNERHSVATGLSRSEVARMLGMHVSSVRRYEKQGLLKPSGKRGEARKFVEAEVLALAKSLGKVPTSQPPEKRGRSDGAIEAAAFRMFRAGATHEQVVINLELPASRVRELFESWRAGYDDTAEEVTAADVSESIHDTQFAAWQHEMQQAYPQGAISRKAASVPKPRRKPRSGRDVL